MTGAAVDVRAAPFAESFDRPFAAAGWVTRNNSNPPPEAPTPWRRGPGVTALTSAGGDADFASACFESAGLTDGSATATASNWLISPPLTFRPGDTVSFQTSAFVEQEFPDRLQLRLNITNPGTDVGATETSVGDFSVLLLDINPGYAGTKQVGTYPTEWTTFTATVAGIDGPTPGRLAFRYFVEDSGPAGSRGNEVGIDNVSTTATPIIATPEPGAAAAVAAGLLVLGWSRRRR